MPKLSVIVPEGMEGYHDDLQFFFETMARKLHTNRHKGFGRDFSFGPLLKGMSDEMTELQDALRTAGQFEVAIEAADVANFGFLVALTAWGMDREQFEKGRDK